MIDTWGFRKELKVIVLHHLDDDNNNNKEYKDKDKKEEKDKVKDNDNNNLSALGLIRDLFFVRTSRS